MSYRKNEFDVSVPMAAKPQTKFLSILNAGTARVPVEKANRIIVINSLCLTSSFLAFTFSLLIFAAGKDYGVLIAGLGESVIFSSFIWLNAKGKYPITAFAYLLIHNIALVYFAVLRGMILEEWQLMFFLFVCSLLILGPLVHIIISISISAAILIFAKINVVFGFFPVTHMDPAAAGPFHDLGTIALSVLIIVAVGHFKWQDVKFISALRRKNETLEAEVSSRTRELVDVNEKLEAANKLLLKANIQLDAANAKLVTTNGELQAANANVRFFYNQFSHDTRDTLHAMLHMTKFLLDALGKKETEAATYAKHLHIAISALVNMGDDILTVKMIEDGLHNKVITETIHFRSWLHNLIKVTRYNAEIRQIQVFADFDKQLPEYVETDPVKLEKIIANLLANAIRHARSMVILRASVIGKYLMLEVKDNGKGIPEQKRSKIFEKNFTSGKGTGLGLYIVQSLCTIMGIKLELKSTEGKSTSFLLKVPYKTGKKEDLPSVDVEERIKVRLTGKRILIADDVPVNLMVLRRHLEMAGCIVVGAADGSELLDIADKQLPDLIIMDYKMPVMDGIQTIKRLRAMPKLARIPVILMTANSSDDGEVLQSDADDYQYKPVSTEKLLRSMAELLQDTEAD